jgi:glycine/D-amino acid oxidase-like deaminating enzyme
MMLGGGLLNAEDEGLADIGISDDSRTSILAASHLLGLLPTVFGSHWGTPTPIPSQVWTSVIGWSADLLPWVGELDERVTHRRGGGREWASVGYSGEGMVNAWLCGAGLAKMLLGEEDGVPEPMRISAERLRRARVEDYLEDYF